ncbi:MAG: hypothetical protein Crog4KO_06430 [Crocinitomicaceae bacterium]
MSKAENFDDPPENVPFGSREHLEWGQVALFEQTKLLEQVHNRIIDSSDSRSIALATTLSSMFETSRSILLLCRNNVRDSYALSRILLDSALNMAQYAIDEELVDKAIRYSHQKSFRDLFREIDLEDFQIKTNLNDVNEIPLPKNLMEAYEEFTSTKGHELRHWSEESKMSAFKKIEIISTEIDEGIGQVLNLCLFSIYRHASEIIHGTLFGTFYGMGLTLPGSEMVRSKEEYEDHVNNMNSYLMSILNLLLESTLRIVDSCYPIEDVLKESRELNSHLSSMTSKK